MSSFLRVIVTALSLPFILSGCVTQPSNVANNNSAVNTPAPAQPQTVKVSAEADEPGVPVTLPVLDAFFADEAFAPALKAKLSLTDEQVARLRSVAREETAKLRETDADDYEGTTAAARTLASERIREVIGEEKAAQLGSFLRERWSGANGEGGAEDKAAAHGTPAKFNAVPADTRVVVNAPAYRMDVFENGQLVKSYKVGIGYPEFPLPTGNRKAANIIFNPTWTPPDEPWVEASTKAKPGETVKAGDKLNPLGPIKIPIGLPSLIHGGKSPAKLGTFASHGCVGLTTPQVQDFTRVLAQLSGTELTDEQIAEYAKNPKETKDVKLARPVTVELRYETIVVEDGKLHIYRDVYDRDTNTEENLRAVLSTYGVTLEQLSEEERAAVTKALKEMSRDAQGRSGEAQPGDNSNASGNTARGAAANVNDNKKAAAADAQVTRSVKGRKEVVVEIAALKGKGYPAAANLDTGGGAKKGAAATKGRKS
ncbi:MAG TPA: L,D-transpeptidase [Pyrinomonadaceae bacterium]|nr:L,D-transpeptidase [Pyrinomonadaceae bacterium]